MRGGIKAGNSAREEEEGMPSLYPKEFRSHPYDASMRNLAKARARWRPPRPWRSNREGQLIRLFVFQWFTCCDTNRPSARAWARTLGVSHTWLQKLVRKFIANPSEMRRLRAAVATDPSAAELARAREETRRMREGGELR